MVAIKDMEIPKSCWNCNFCFNKNGYCCAISNELLADEAADIPSENRPTDCPLVEIVTCKDCKCECTWKNGEKFSETRPNFYCADGERRE